MKVHHQRYIDFFEQLTEQALTNITDLFSTDARFKDPFNDVRGVKSIHKIFAHMFDQVRAPSFKVSYAAVDDLGKDDVLLLVWDFTFLSQKGQQYQWQGSSKVLFDEEGKVLEHIDYWDPAEALYSKIPVVGGVINWLRQRLSTPTE